MNLQLLKWVTDLPSFFHRPQQTGREIIEDMFKNREWELLNETGRRELQQEIRIYMDRSAGAFDTPITSNLGVTEKWFNADKRLLYLKNAQKRRVPIVVVEGELERVPTDRDIADAEADFKAKTKAYENETQRVGEAVITFHTALEKMAQELVTPLTGATSAAPPKGQ